MLHRLTIPEKVLFRSQSFYNRLFFTANPRSSQTHGSQELARYRGYVGVVYLDLVV